VGDSTDASLAAAAQAYFGRKPELVVLDASHAYGQTLRDLEVWASRLPVGGIMLVHGTSDFATRFDPSDAGGIKRAVEEWVPQHPEFGFLSLNAHVMEGQDANELVYKDGCGLGILQRLPAT
jgi:cephalosporin hydroxylase